MDETKNPWRIPMGWIYLPIHEWFIFMVNVGEYTVPYMDPMGMVHWGYNYPTFRGCPPFYHPTFLKEKLQIHKTTIQNNHPIIQPGWCWQINFALNIAGWWWGWTSDGWQYQAVCFATNLINSCLYQSTPLQEINISHLGTIIWYELKSAVSSLGNIIILM